MKCKKCGCEMTCKTIDASRQWYEYWCPKCGYGNGYATISEERNPDCPIVSASELEVEQKWRDLRNQAAIAAMQGVICVQRGINNWNIDINKLSNVSVTIADRLIEELKKQ